MKVLLDENLDHRLRHHLGSHEVFTSSFMGWSGLKNGMLLSAAEQAGFDLLLTGDRSLYQEQNLKGRRLAIVAMSSVEWKIRSRHLNRILATVEAARPGSFQAVDCGIFTRKHPRNFV